jgi:glycosyltransferase involved in cell wall biosynthesis
MNNVLIITYYWPPSGGSGVQRWLKFAKYLPAFGVTPIVLTVKPECAEYPIVDESLAEDISPQLQVHHTDCKGIYEWYKRMTGSKYAPYSGFANEGNPTLLQKAARFVRGNFFLPDARRGWIGYAFREACNIIEQQNVQTVITTGPPHSTHLTGLRLKKKYGIRWIVDFRDPWTGLYYNNMLYQTAIARKIDRYYERKTLSRCDALTLVADNRTQLPVDSAKAHFLPNGFDEPDFSSAIPVCPDVFTISYFGTMSASCSIDALLHSLSECRFAFKLQFVGKIPENTAATCRRLLGDRFALRNFVTHKEAIAGMCSSSLLMLVISESKRNQQYIITGKLFEYLATGKPILLIGPTDGTAARIIREAGAGAAFAPDDTSGISRYLEEQYRYFRSGNVPLPDKEYIRRFSRKKLTEELARIIQTSV